MKVFWSWQSDTPGKIGRHFVRDAIEAALAELKAGDKLDEPIRDVELDHDRKGIPGSPDLAKTILEKIKSSAVVVADVTPVGKTSGGKYLINSNVAIEFGYALNVLGDTSLLMVLNEAYGDRNTLPFDLRHKAGPILFKLSPDAPKEEMDKERHRLITALKPAIKDCLAAKRRESEDIIQAHQEIPQIASCAEYFKKNEVLAQRKIDGNIELRYTADALIYLRIIPSLKMARLRESEIQDLVFGIKIPPLNFRGLSGASHERNKYGGITFAFNSEDKFIITSTQIFHNREIWGLDAVLLHRQKIIPSTSYEEVLSLALDKYVESAEKLLGYTFPIIVEAGATGIEGYSMGMPSKYYTPLWGPIYQTEIRSRHNLANSKKATIDSVLLKIFEDFFDATGHRRPENFRNFPNSNR